MRPRLSMTTPKMMRTMKATSCSETSAMSPFDPFNTAEEALVLLSEVEDIFGRGAATATTELGAVGRTAVCRHQVSWEHVHEIHAGKT